MSQVARVSQITFKLGFNAFLGACRIPARDYTCIKDP